MNTKIVKLSALSSHTTYTQPSYPNATHKPVFIKRFFVALMLGLMYIGGNPQVSLAIDSSNGKSHRSLNQEHDRMMHLMEVAFLERANHKKLFGDAQGIVVIDVLSNSSGDKAGLSRGDILVSYAGKPINSVSQFVQLVNKKAHSISSIILAFVRNGKIWRTTVHSGKVGAQIKAVPLSLAYIRGQYIQAFNEIEPLAKKGNRRAQHLLGIMFGSGQGVKKNPKKSFEWSRLSAKNDYSPSQVNLGYKYEHGYGVEQNYQSALFWYKAAADQDDPNGQFYLGTMYLTGKGENMNYAKAFGLFFKSSEQANPAAEFNLGNMYANGQGIKQDFAKAAKWYREAANQGIALAQSKLGSLYATGKGVKKSYGKAAILHEKAAKHGVVFSQAYLGYMYANGLGVIKDYSKAAKWYQKAAEQGDSTAQGNLGALYANGQGVDADYRKAIKWYALAKKQGNKSAGILLHELETRIKGIKKQLTILKLYNGPIDGTINHQTLVANNKLRKMVGLKAANTVSTEDFTRLVVPQNPMIRIKPGMHIGDINKMVSIPHQKILATALSDFTVKFWSSVNGQ